MFRSDFFKNLNLEACRAKFQEAAKEKNDVDLNADDPYLDIYSDVNAELQDVKIDHIALFNHCIRTCHEIFELSEFCYGKAAKNIPPDILGELATLYFGKTLNPLEYEEPAEGKYAYFTPHTNYPDRAFSIADLSEVILGKDADPLDKDNKRNELWKLNQNYLGKFFGIKYDDKSGDQGAKYETLRLLKILHDCIYECEVDLAYLLRFSFLKQTSKIPTSYSKALDFIKARIIVKDIEYFKLVMKLECYNNAVRSFINAFSEGIVDHMLRQIESPNPRIKRFICGKVYERVIDNLNATPLSELARDNDADYIQRYAYEHFLMADIIDEEYSKFYSEIFVVEAEEGFYNRAEAFLTTNDIASVTLDELSDFVGKHKRGLVKVVHSNIADDTELRKLSIRIERHKDDYAIVGRVYNSGINRDEFSNLSGLEVVAIAYLYEYLSDNGTDIPLHSGYISTREDDQKRRDLKIKALVKQLRARFEKTEIDSPLSEEEYFLACQWLTEQMYMLMNCRTVELQTLREMMKSALLKYWRRTIPLLTPSDDEIQLESLIEKILPIQQRQAIISEAIS